MTPGTAVTGAGHDKMEGNNQEGEPHMAAMKPRTGDGPMEAVKEGRLIIVRVPLEGGGRLVVSVNDEEAKELHGVLSGVVEAA
ncbi:hypothetical protein GCM10010915_16250 [Microbacterium faecale]|uniref:DUF3117 domain-containing protein n=2 Tax=Microbacteriaceae TaxID=85023 RepID=A0A917DFN2_9MICO|nr:hypothetical protein GCM10010915_16250 [Microbacterium faecale]